MATDNRSITITLKLQDDTADATDTSTQTNTQNSSAEDKSSSRAKAAARALAIQALTVAANEGMAWAEYMWNRELTLNDDYIGQRNKRIALTQINRGISMISTIGTSTASGAAVGGPVGAAAGAIIGTATAVLGVVRSNVQGQMDQDLLLRQTNAQLNFTRGRAGYALKAASIGEDL